MALRALLLKKEIDSKRSALEKLDRNAEFEKRSAELEAAIAEMTDESTEEQRNAVSEEIDKLEAEKAEVEAAVSQLREELAKLEAELDETEKEQEVPADPKPEERTNQMGILTRDSAEYINAYANYIKTGDIAQVRSLVTELADVEGSGPVPVPTFIEGVIKTAWEEDQLLSRVSRVQVKGILKQAFEISATDAAYHAEGTAAPEEEDLVLGVVSITPKMIKKWITVTDEALTMGGETFLRYIYEELAHKITEFAANEVVATILNTSDDSGNQPGKGPTPEQGAIRINAIEIGTIAQALGKLSSKAQNPVVIMNRATWSAFKAAQYAANFPVDPFEGLPVLFNNSLPTMAEAAESESALTIIIVGDLSYGVKANFPNGFNVDILRDPYSKAPEDLERIIGKLYMGLGVVGPHAFCKVDY